LVCEGGVKATVFPPDSAIEYCLYHGTWCTPGVALASEPTPLATHLVCVVSEFVLFVWNVIGALASLQPVHAAVPSVDEVAVTEHTLAPAPAEVPFTFKVSPRSKVVWPLAVIT
jgi:hypothetical protein